MFSKLLEVYDNTRELVVIGAALTLVTVMSIKITKYVTAMKSTEEYIIDAEYEDVLIEKD